MDRLKEKIISESDTFASCILLSKEIDKILKKADKKAAILSNFTVKGLSECLKVKSFANDIFLQVYEGEYGQWKQEILGNKLYEFKPDIIFLLIDAHGLDNNILYENDDIKHDEINKLKEEAKNELLQFVNYIKSKTSAKIIVSNSCNWYIDYCVFNNITRRYKR